MQTTVIIGAGWAGLSCAYELAKAGHSVKVIEAAPQAGGRARSIKFKNLTIDNGQHICIGAYHTLRAMLKELGLQEQHKFKIMPLELIMHGNKKVHLKLPNIPAPYNLIAGLVMAKNISWMEKIQIVNFARQVHKKNFCLPFDCTVQQLLEHYHQSKYVIDHLWAPLALAAMSTSITEASAQVFLNILQQVFYCKNTYSNWFIPAVDLNNLLPDYITRYLQNTGNQIVYNQPVKNIHIYDQYMIASSNANSWRANNIVLATHPLQTIKLLHPHPQLQDCYRDLTKLTYEPITTLYFLFSEAIQLPYPILGFLNTTFHWIFDRAFAAQPNILSIVITGKTLLKFNDKDALCQQVLQDLRKVLPQLPEPISTKVICEKYAAFSCNVESQKIRPKTKTSIKNLWLSGDYIQTGLPATLEGALLSGKQTAMEILRGA